MNSVSKINALNKRQRLIYIKKIAYCLGIFFILWPADHASLMELHLNEAIHLAMKNNYGIQIERLELKNLDSEVVKKQMEFIPRTELKYSMLKQKAQPAFGGTYDRETNDYQVGLSQKIPYGGTLSVSFLSGLESMSGIQEDVRLSDDDVYSEFSVLWNQPLLKGGLAGPNLADIRIAKFDRQIQENVLSESHLELISKVKTAFYQVVHSQKIADVNEKVLKISQEVLDLIRSRSELGISPKIDTMRAQIENNKSEEALLVSRQNLAAAKMNLQNLIGIDDSVVALNHSNEHKPEVAVDDAIAIALENNQQLQQIKGQLAKQQLTVNVAKNDMLPQLDAFARLGKIRDAFEPLGYTDDYRAGLLLSYPLYNVGLVENLRQEERTLKKLKLKQKNYKTEIINTLMMLINQLKLSDKRIEILEAQHKIVNEEIKIVLKAFDEGLIGLNRVYDAQNDLSQEERRYLAALLERNSKWFAILTVMGVENYDILPPNNS